MAHSGSIGPNGTTPTPQVRSISSHRLSSTPSGWITASRATPAPIPDFQTLQQTTYRQDAVIRDVLIHAYDQIDLEEVWVAYQHFSEIRSLVADILAQDQLALKICRR